MDRITGRDGTHSHPVVEHGMSADLYWLRVGAISEAEYQKRKADLKESVKDA